MYPVEGSMHLHANSRKVLVLSPADSRLIEQFVAACEGLSPERAAESLEGVSSATVRRYMEGHMPTRMTTEVRQSLREFLKSREGADEDDGGGQYEEPAEDEWAPLVLEGIRFVNGGEHWSEDERRLIQIDLIEGYIRAGRARGRDVGALQDEQKRLLAEAGMPERRSGEDKRLRASDVLELYRQESAAAMERAIGMRHLSRAAELEAEESRARRTGAEALSEEEREILAAEAHVRAEVDALDRAAAEAEPTRPTPSPAPRRGPHPPAPRRETR